MCLIYHNIVHVREYLLLLLSSLPLHFISLISRFKRSHNIISAISNSLNEALPIIFFRSFFIVNETLPLHLFVADLKSPYLC